jgi:hypothetical protein
MGTDICNDDAARQGITFEQCQSRRGGVFNITAAQTQNLYSSASDDGLKPDRNWENINPKSNQIYGKPGRTVLDFPFGPSLSQVLLSIITENQNTNLGHLGVQLANASFLEALSKAGYPSDGWGLNAGSTSDANWRPGNIVLGGYDRASVRGAFTTFQINNNPDLENERYCPLQVEITNMEIRVPGNPSGNPSFNLIDPSDTGVKACIEP